MQQTLVSREAQDAASSLPAQYLKAFRFMLLARVLDEKMAGLYRAGKIQGGVFLGRGQEAFSVALGLALRKGDVFAPLIRDGAGRLAFGEPVLDAVRTYLGSALGPMRGRDGNVHRGRPREGLLAMISHLGAMISVVNGALMARRFKKIEGVVGAACIGDGGTSTGAFHEGLNQAAVERLPLVLALANNQYAYSTPTRRQFACDDLIDKAIGYGVAAREVDGTDLEACLRAISASVAQARAGGGPQLVVGRLLRLCGHAEHDDAQYVDAQLKNSPLGRDCLKVAEERVLREGWADADILSSLRQQVALEVDEAVATVQREPAPDPYKENWCALKSRHLSEVFEVPRPAAMSITYLEAIRSAQAKALADDPRVFIYGQDVGAFGGAFKATKNLAREFPGRVLDAPISEDAIVGAAIGAAIEGMRPIIEMQYADFSTPGFNQIINQAATLYWRTQVPCPITIRLPSGGTSGAGPFHSQSMESLYAHYPGLIVMTPATVEDAYSMLLEAVAIDDPVIFCEHKRLYYHLKAPALPTEAMPVGKARIARAGRDLTIVTYSAMVQDALAAAEELAAEGSEIEVVDLRTVKPLDTDTVMASVARTGRLLCVGESFPWGGVTAEVLARVATEGFGLLDAPPQRLNAKDTPIPYHPNLWLVHRPTAQSVCAAARNLLQM